MQDSASVNYIGRIPVRNLWFLMLYASDLFREIGTSAASVEDNPDDIPDLIGEILTAEVERRLRRNLTFGYQTRFAELNRVRGRIDLFQTDRKQLLNRGKVACRFDELTVDTIRNRFVRAALEVLAKIVQSQTIAHRCRGFAAILQRSGVSTLRPTRSEVSKERFGRHDAGDRVMFNAAKLAFDLALITEDPGVSQLPTPDRDIVWVRRLFEKGIAGFYQARLAQEGWVVHAGSTINWQITDYTSGIPQILPSMKTDITLENSALSRRIIIDTKFNALLIEGWYREASIRSGYIYQIYAYLLSQSRPDDQLANTATGLLLHPSVGSEVFESVVIQGHEIRFATVNLAASAQEISHRLIKIVKPSLNH